MWRAEAEIGSSLGWPVELAWATRSARLRRCGAVPALAPSALTRGEAAQWQTLRSDVVRQEWLASRAALRALLGDGQDTSGLVFPHPALSLTHAGGLAVAVRADGAQVGVGIDFEPWRPDVDLRVARFFLTPSEQAGAGGAQALLRLWTIKEALYKATPDNAPLVMIDFELTDPGATSGEAIGPRGELLRYAGVEVSLGHLTVAVCLVGNHAAV